MQQDELLSEETPSPQKGCANCGHPVIESGHVTNLCSDCRKKFIRFPIPLPIRLFGIGIALVVIFAMFSLPKNLSLGIHYKKGKEAAERRDYVTAQQELTNVVKNTPNFIEAKTHLAVASFYNLDFQTFLAMTEKLEGKEIEDADMYGKLNNLIDHLGEYLPLDSFLSIINTYGSIDSIPDPVYRSYFLSHSDELFPLAIYAGKLVSQDDWKTADSVLNVLLGIDPRNIRALQLKTGVKREFLQFDSSHYYCDRVLALNRQSSYAASSKARTFLRQKNDLEGMRWAIKGSEIDPTDSYAKATMALAYHFNNKMKERDAVLEEMKSDSTAAYYRKFAVDVIEGKEKFRD